MRTRRAVESMKKLGRVLRERSRYYGFEASSVLGDLGVVRLLFENEGRHVHWSKSEGMSAHGSVPLALCALCELCGSV